MKNFFNKFKKRSFRSDVLHIFLNIVFASVLYIVIQTTESLSVALLLIVISKWRVFAVRPRFWLMHLESNLVDYIVGFSMAILMYLAHIGSQGIVVFLYFLIYVYWLIYLKPKSKRRLMHVQAGFALFLGVTALYSVSYDWWSSVVVLFMWIIGYGVARHVLFSYDDQAGISLLSFAWALGFAELGWVAYHWTVAYTLLGNDTLAIPRAAITLLCFGFISEKAFESYHRHQEIRFNDILMPIIFTLAIIILLPLILSFAGPSVTVGL